MRWPSYDAPASRARPGGSRPQSAFGLLAGEKHGQYVQVPDDDLRAVYLWLDAQVPFYGTYEEKDLVAQKLARAVPPPPLQ